jgi:hypothetical protein
VVGWVRRNAIALLALFVALGGTAVAVSKIGAGDIKRNAVRSKHVKDGQIKAGDADLVKYKSVQSEVTTTGPGPADGTPAITVDAKAGDLAIISARVTIERTLGDDPCQVRLAIMAADDSSQRVMNNTSEEPEPTWTNPTTVPGGPTGTDDRGNAAPLTLPIAEPGEYTFALYYQGEDTGTNCSFTDRNLWVELVR